MSAPARAEALADLGRYDEALRLTAAAPQDGWTALLRARCLLALGRPAEAERQAREAIPLGADEGWALLLLAYALLHQRRPAQAAEAARSAVVLDPGDHGARVCLSDCLREQGLAGLALEAAGHAVRLAPDQASTHVAVSRALRAAGVLDRAEAAARTALQQDPQDADAAAALAEVLQSMHRLGEAQEVRLAGVLSDPASADGVTGLADVTGTALLGAMGLTVVVPVLLSLDRSNTPVQVLEAAVTVWAVTGVAFLLLRRGVQRSLSDGARRALAPHRRRQERAHIAALSAALLAVTGRAVWDAALGGSWRPVPLLLALTVATYWWGTRGTDRRGGWAAVGRELAKLGPWTRGLGRPGAWAELRARQRAQRRSLELLRPVLPAGAGAEELAPAAVFARNASFLGHVWVLLGGSAVATLLAPDHPWVALPVALVLAGLDAAVTDNLWPRLARRSRWLWTLEPLHVRVVDATTGRPPGWGRSAVRGVLRLLLLPYLVPQAFRRRTQVWVAPHDRLTGTRVVRVLIGTEAEAHASGDRVRM